jgi:hypothetical protein
MLAADPYTEMDRLVRNELGAGRTTGQVTDDFRPILGAALETPGLTAEGKESLLSTLDSLTGNCHPEQWYDDPPEVLRAQSPRARSTTDPEARPVG